jgi:hypothetical protein
MSRPAGWFLGDLLTQRGEQTSADTAS